MGTLVRGLTRGIATYQDGCYKEKDGEASKRN